ncbi:MAG: ABC transporter ATP-binding protein, partial [Burkholderiales bacterium]|nr:ABC transporter ATP-binding protein [Burkholderiales bacterium]
MALLELKGVTRRFGDFTAVDQVSFSVEAGEFFTLLGPSGCGKTCILRMIAGFDQPDAGDILLDGASLAGLAPEARPFHTVFQSYALFPHMTVAQNVAFPLRMRGRDAAAVRARVAEVLEMVALAPKAQQYPHELSGGQKQRVAVARALADLPRILLLDEPLGALDAKLREQMQVELIRLQRDIGITFIFVTHAQPEALALSRRIGVMRQGRIAQLDTPQRIYGNPVNRFVADFIGHCTLIAAAVEAVEEDRLVLACEGLGRIEAPRTGAARAGQRGTLSLRPEQLRIGAPGIHAGLPNRAAGRILDLLYAGDVTTYIVECVGGLRLEA